MKLILITMMMLAATPTILNADPRVWFLSEQNAAVPEGSVALWRDGCMALVIATPSAQRSEGTVNQTHCARI